jgi:hypothetical protein
MKHAEGQAQQGLPITLIHAIFAKIYEPLLTVQFIGRLCN